MANAKELYADSAKKAYNAYSQLNTALIAYEKVLNETLNEVTEVICKAKEEYDYNTQIFATRLETELRARIGQINGAKCTMAS